MKKRIFSLFFVLSLIFPMFMLTACKDKDPTVSGISVVFDDESQSVDYVVDDKTITTTYNPSANYALDASDFVITLKYSDETTKTLTASDVSLYTFTSTIPTTITDGVVPAGSYTLTFASGDYSDTYTFVVNKATIDMSNVAWSTGFVYDGTEKTNTLNGLDNLSVPVTASYTGNTATNAGSYTAVATLSYDSANYVLSNAPTLENTWTIEKGTIALNVNDIWSYDATSKPVYNTTAHSVSVLASELPEGVSVASYTGTTNATNAGTYTAGVVFAQTAENLANWNEIDSTAYGISWEIVKATIDLSDTTWQTTTSFIYDGTAKSVALVDLDSKVTATYANATKTDAGSYTAVATLAYDSANYVLSNTPTLEKAWTISKATLSLANATWTGAEETLVYNGTEKTVTFSDPQIGGAIISVTYTGNTATNAGTYIATAILHYNSSNYDLPADVSVLTYTWTIEKAEYNMPTITWNYTTPIVYDSEEHTVSVTNNNLPTGVTVAGYENNKATDKGVYVASVIFSQDTTNYELIDASVYNLTWQIVSEDCMTVKFDDNNWTQAQFESIPYIPYGSVIELSPLEGYTLEFRGIVYVYGEICTIESTSMGNNYPIVVNKDVDGTEVLSMDLECKKFDTIKVDGQVYDASNYSIAVQLSSPTATTVTINFGNDTVTGQSYVSKYANNLQYSIDGGEPAYVTADNMTLSVNVYDRIVIYLDGNTEFYICVYEWSPFEKITYTTVDFDEKTREYEAEFSGDYNIVSYNEFVTSISAELKAGLTDYTYEFVTESNVKLTANNLINGNILDEEIYTNVYDADGNLVYEDYLSVQNSYDLGLSSYNGYNNVYYVYTTENTFTLSDTSKFTIGGQKSVTHTEYGVYAYELSTSLEYNERTYTVSYPVIINYSPKVSDYIDSVQFNLNESYIDFSSYRNSIYGIELENLVDFDVDTALTETMVDGWEISDKEFVVNGAYYIKYTFVATDDPTQVVVTYVNFELGFVVNNSTNLSYATLYSNNYTNGLYFDVTGDTIELEDMNSLNSFDIQAENEGMLIVLLDENNNVLEEGYGYVDLSFKSAGTYSLKITSSDKTTTRTITLNVFGEFLPLMRATYGDTVLVIDLDMESGVQKGNMDMMYGITVDATNTPSAVISVLSSLGMIDSSDTLQGMYFVGYLPTAKDIATNTITLNVVTLLAEDQVVDQDLNPIDDYANAELAIVEDAILGKYAVVYASSEGMVIPVIFYLEEKVWPLQITLGSGENTVTLNYQIDMDMNSGSGNMYFGNFVMDMNAGGMTATISASDIGLTGTVTELDATLTFTSVPADLSYVVMSTDGQSIYMPTAGNLSVPATFAVTDTGDAYVLTFYVCMPGSTMDEPMPLPLIITITK